MDWMAWTWPTAIFFMVIASLLITFTVLAIKFPETPRTGILRIETTRGDRLFITLLGSAFINLAWLGLVGQAQPAALIVCLIYAGTLIYAAEHGAGRGEGLRCRLAAFAPPTPLLPGRCARAPLRCTRHSATRGWEASTAESHAHFD